MNEQTHFQVVIPARYASTRLPGKPLSDIHGRPMVAWVVAAAEYSRASGVYVATDDERVALAVEQAGGRAVRTREDHTSGTDRLAEVAAQMGWSDHTLVVNVQGDEPGMPPALINQVADLLNAHPEAGVASLYTRIYSTEELANPHAVKVVVDQAGRALYFSRAGIPFDRDGAHSAQPGDSGAYGKRHVGLYAYRVGALRQFVGWSPTPLEQLEKLEQLRFMEQGVTIAMAEAAETPPAGVDTEADLHHVRQTLGGAQ